jgi:hypothetical protein
MKTVLRPPCPDHKGSRVQFSGSYGSPGHKRQRYRCFPRNGAAPHTFTEALPREEAQHDHCLECEREVGRHEGPQAPRKYQFVARMIARALTRLGAGATYKQAAREARLLSNRLRMDDTGDLVASDHGQLAGDWVEVFAPVVFELHRPDAWPTTGSVVLDHIPFRCRDPFNPGKSYIAFDIFCAMGYEDGRPRIWRLEAFTDANKENWRAFLRSLPGQPPRVVCDAHSGMLAALDAEWPDAQLYLSEWHLRHALERLLDKLPEPEARDLRARTEAAFAGSSFWLRFVEDAQKAAIPRLDKWLREMGYIVGWQFEMRGRSDQRRADTPLSTGGLEEKVKPIEAALFRRRYGLKNRERLNRLLMLFQLEANAQANETEYAKAIRDWLLANGGRPRVGRRAITDVAGSPSLRARRGDTKTAAARTTPRLPF